MSTSSSIKKLQLKAEKGDIKAAIQISEYYEEGRYVSQDKDLAQKYLDTVLHRFKSQKLRIDSLRLINFKGFSESEVKFENGSSEASNVTILIGNNGSGKSAILEALTKSMSWLKRRITAPNISNSNGIQIITDEIKASETSASLLAKFSTSPKNSFNLELSKTVETAANAKKNTLEDITTLAKLYRLSTENDPNFSYPLLAHYGVERTIEVTKKEADSITSAGTSYFFNKNSGYHNALKGSAEFNLFFNWFKYVDDIKNENPFRGNSIEDKISKLKLQISESTNQEIKEKLDDLFKYYSQASAPSNISETHLNAEKVIKTIQNAINNFMPEFSNLRIERVPQLNILVDKDGISFKLNQLSQGEKSLIALIADISRRLFLLNPGIENPLEGYGIVTIDEIELHLHPKWQQTIVHNLTRTFPNIQFILSTHSPEVLTTVKRESIRILAPNKYGDQTVSIPHAHSYGEYSDDVMQAIMGVNPQPPVPERDALEELTELVDQGEFESTRVMQLFNSLESSLSPTHPQLQRIRRSIDIKKVLKK